MTRFLISIEAAGLPCTLVLNKADLVPQVELQRRMAQCKDWGYEAVPISCETGEGVQTLATTLKGKTAVVAGPSGTIQRRITEQ